MASTTESTIYVVTGGNRGLGLGLVKALLARPSTTVVATVRNEDAAASLESDVKLISTGTNSTLQIVQLDFSATVAPEKIREVFMVDHIDVLICNAGGAIGPMVPASQVKAEDLRANFELNAVAPLMVFQALQPLLQKAKSAPKVIMMTSSVGAISDMEPVPGGAYGPSKAALNYLARALHFQEEAAGLVAVAMHPGWVQTRSGEYVAKEWNFPAAPPVTVEESVRGMLEVIDGATRDSVSGKFVTYQGEILNW